MLALCLMLLHTYYAHFSASIISAGLPIFEGIARLSSRVWRRFVRGSREISLAPSLHRASTDALILPGFVPASGLVHLEQEEAVPVRAIIDLLDYPIFGCLKLICMLCVLCLVCRFFNLFLLALHFSEHVHQ